MPKRRSPFQGDKLLQEHITRNLQLPYIPVTAFSQTDLFFSLNLSRIQIPKGTSLTKCNHKHGRMRPHCLTLPKRAHIDWNWPISREKYLNIDWSVKMPLHWLIMRIVGS